MMKSLPLVFFLLLSLSAKAQLYSGMFHIQWSIFTPVSDKDYIDKTSAAGLNLGYTKLINDRFGVGIEAGYNTLDDYIPRKTYEVPGGAYTTDFYNYMDYYTVMVTGQYYFKQSERFMPYASLGAGIAFSQYTIYYNVYQMGENHTGFALRPAVGTTFKPKEYANWALKAAINYDYAITKSYTYEIDNLSGFAVQLGVVFFTD